MAWSRGLIYNLHVGSCRLRISQSEGFITRIIVCLMLFVDNKTIYIFLMLCSQNWRFSDCKFRPGQPSCTSHNVWLGVVKFLWFLAFWKEFFANYFHTSRQKKIAHFYFITRFCKKPYLFFVDFLQIIKVEHKSFPIMYHLSYLDIKHGT